MVEFNPRFLGFSFADKTLNLVFSKPSLDGRARFNPQFSGFRFAGKRFKLGFFKTKS
jgi:hypothetical protein